MHSEKDGDKLNEKIEPNPNPKDKRPMYIGKRVRHDKKVKFDPKILSWKYPKKDKKKVAPTRGIILSQSVLVEAPCY